MTGSWAAAQVVIVGAGPVGLMLAGELGRADVPVIVVERLDSPMTESRASQLTTLTAELLHERGCEALLGEAVHEPRAHFGGLGFDLSGLDSEYAGNWKVPQYRTEAVLAERAEGLGVTVLRAHELTEITELPDHVVCGVRGPDGDARIRARYVVGCDGAWSTVRRLCGFPVSARAATKELLRADVTGIRVRDRRFERLDGGFATAATRDGVTRVMVHVAGQGVAERTGPPEFGEVARAWQKVTGEDISGGTAVWVDSFDNSRGQADAYRRGRVLLAGDAAHWHMPIGGQSLNVGLQDAVNLGWKLAGTVRGWAAPGVLDSYHDERHPVAARVLNHVAAQEVMLLGGAEIEPLRDVFSELTGLSEVRAHVARVAANLDDRYGPPESPLIGRRVAKLGLRTEAGPLRVAGSAPVMPVLVRLAPASDDPGRFTIPTIHAIDEKGSLPGITAILLRPDGYVAWAGDSEEGVHRAIGKLLRAEGREENAEL
ncbi:FAD-binding monooxygenase [Actinobacteria bacterium YIM 96077]|uniref:FAD-binding monooxygenase n=1 Tax=Phytoactinopolyspora halophila TaxID=1981511 RepID=A0A329QGT3_9ACTN|nr:FAD-dependent monooxygenase [Phytoactinopolyspora halophila]AYY12633.1 FAD-binding monooxygenase [Actinobacteria bacterium YIM 96077]RAW09508.1 FAD-binding monooxygenase [Phytoactinopolyspora halophila]